MITINKIRETDGVSTSATTTARTNFEPLLSSSPSRSRSVSPILLPPLQQQHHHENLLLSFPLRFSYSCIGMIMSLPSTALLYFVNKFIAIPVSLLPLYLSISFLPYSLKPSYAYMSTSLTHYNLSQQIQIICLLLICGSSHIITAFTPQNAISLSFMLAFTRSITLAWPNFLLDLCLLDEVDNIILSLAPLPPQESSSTSSSSSSAFAALSYADVAAAFQSQAATYRSMGCVAANVLALVVYAAPNLLSSPLHSESHQKIHDSMNHRIFQFILICTGVLNFVCAILLWRNPRNSIERHQYQSVLQPSDKNETSISQILSSNNTQSETDNPATTKSVMRLHSYDSIEDDLLLPVHHPTLSKSGLSLELDTCVVDTEPLLLRYSNNTINQNNDTHTVKLQHIPPPAIVNHKNVRSTNSSNNYFNRSNSIGLVVLLQLLVVLLTLRQSLVQNFITKIGWTCLVSILTVLFFYCAYYQSSKVRTHSDANETTTATNTRGHEETLRVGLYLILRYSIPSVSYLMSSYIYTIYEDIPSILQILSLLDMCVTTFACYIYSKYLSKYSAGKQLLWLIVTTTMLSGISSFGNVILIRVLNPKSPTQHEQHDDENYSMTTKIICTIVINAIIGFFNEWKFFPDVVLATAVSVGSITGNTFETSSTSLSHDEVSPAGRTIHETTNDDPLRPTPMSQHDDGHNASAVNNNTASSSSLSLPAARGVQYGTLLSCIDFGDQIGILLAGPLIAIFHTTRSNSSSDDHWQHLEVLQIINSIMILLSAFLIFILTARR